MENTQRLVRTWMVSGRDEEVEETVSEISNERITLINVVKALGEYLTSEEDDLRTKGVDFLSLVLGLCPSERFNRQSVRVLTNFYCEKLDDTETIIPALKGLVTLTDLPTFSSSDATSVVQALFAHVKMKSLVQSVRFFVFVIFDTMIAKHRDALNAMGKAFVAGYISLAEGEKDPRNLLVAFAIARVILIEFDISDHTESLFNITFCYFPITFRPPPDDPYGITTDDLRLALRSCLAATPSFGPLAIPVFLEKLAAGSPATKRDTLQALATCMPVYGSLLARASARKLWNALKLEIFQPVDPLTEEEALKATQTLVKTIYTDVDKDSHKEIQGLAREACEECIQVLQEPEKSQAKPAIKILCAFMATTPSISRYTLSQAVPHLLKLLLNPDEISNRPPILLLLADLISAARDSMSGIEDPGRTPLMPYKDEVLGAMSAGLQDVASRRAALTGIMGMVTTSYLFSDEELGFVVHSVNQTLQEDSDNDVREMILDVLSTISVSAPRHVQEQTLPLLFESLPDHAPSREAASDRAKSWCVLSALSALCVHPELFEILVIRLTTKVDLICIPITKRSAEDEEPNAAYAHSLLNIIANTLSAKVDKGHLDVAKYIDRLVPRLYNLFIYSALLGEGQGFAATDPRLVNVAGKIITLVVQCLPLPRQEKFAANLFRAFSSGDFEGIAEGYQKIPPETKIFIFNAAAPCVQKNLIMLFSAGIISLRKELRSSAPALDDFLDMLLTWSLQHADNDLQRNFAWHIISSVVNKRAEDLPTFLSDKLDHFWIEKIIDKNIAQTRRQQAIQSWIWISRALTVRNHRLAPHFTARVFEAFSDETISWNAAKAIGEIAAVDPILTKRNHAVIKVLHAQKFVIAVLPKIIAGTQDFNKPCEQTAYLVALTSLVKAVPKATYAHEMPTLMPLFLRGLELPDAEIRANVIDTFLAAAEGDPSEHDLVSEHASTLVTIMLRNCLVEQMPSIRVRTSALRYLGVLPSIVRYNVLHPHKSVVIHELAKAVDDPKRSVRKEAVNTRMVWFKYSG